MKAVLCPVCDGCGEFVLEACEETDGIETTALCHGCNGRGWVGVPEGASVSVIKDMLVDFRERLAQFMPTPCLELEMKELRGKYARKV